MYHFLLLYLLLKEVRNHNYRANIITNNEFRIVWSKKLFKKVDSDLKHSIYSKEIIWLPQHLYNTCSISFTISKNIYRISTICCLLSKLSSTFYIHIILYSFHFTLKCYIIFYFYFVLLRRTPKQFTDKFSFPNYHWHHEKGWSQKVYHQSKTEHGNIAWECTSKLYIGKYCLILISIQNVGLDGERWTSSTGYDKSGEIFTDLRYISVQNWISLNHVLSN